jgi:hypothetical protein
MNTTIKYSDFFESRQRNDGTSFIALKDERPEYLSDFLYEIHGGYLPDDWTYRIIMEAFEELEIDNLEDITIEADCYYHDLDQWFSLYRGSHELCNEALEDFGPFDDIYKIISTAQVLAKERIYEVVNDFMETHKNDEIKEEEIK